MSILRRIPQVGSLTFHDGICNTLRKAEIGVPQATIYSNASLVQVEGAALV